MPALAQEIAKTLLEAGCVHFRLEQPYVWASGIRSPIYCDNRLLMGSLEGRGQVREAFCRRIREEQIPCDLVVGVATGAIPHAAWLAEHLQKPMAYVRTAAKTHGKENRVEGKSNPGARAILIEDLVSTGGSSAAAVDALRKAGAQVKTCLAIFSYGFPEAKEVFQKINCRLLPLTDLPTLLQTAGEIGVLDAKSMETLDLFAKNPRGWGR